MSRALALSLCLLSVSLVCLPARAEPTPASVSAPLPKLSVSVDPDTARTDQWVLAMTDARARREERARWGVPLMLSGATLLGAGFAVLPDLSVTSRSLFAAAAVLPAALIIPASLAAPRNKQRWLALGGFLFAAGISAGGLVQASEQTGCSGWCGNERAVGWLSAAFLPSMLLLELAFIDRGPTLRELQDYARLPEHNRAVIGRKLIARIDRAERKALAIEMAIDLMAMGILATGAALVRDDQERALLLGFGGATFGVHTIVSLTTLLSPTRLEKLARGLPPAKERVFW